MAILFLIGEKKEEPEIILELLGLYIFGKRDMISS